MRLFFKIFIPISVLLVLVMSVITFVNISDKISLTEESYTKELDISINMMNTTLDVFIDNVSSMVKLASDDTELVHLMENYNKNGKFDSLEEKQIWTYLKKEKDAIGITNNVFVSGAEGFIIYDALKAFYDKHYNLENTSFFLGIKDYENVDIYLDVPKIAPANQKPTFVIASRILSDEFIGILSYSINIHGFLNQVIYPKLNDDNIQVLMVDSEGKIFGAKDENVIYNEKYYLTNIDNKLFQEMQENKNGTLKRMFLDTDAIITYDYYEPFDAYFLAYNNTQELKKNTFSDIMASIYLLILLLLASLVIVFVVVKRITKPLRHLAKYSEKIGAGMFSFEIEPEIISRKDEIGVLGKTFENMLESIQESFSKLELYTEKIEYIAEHDALTNLYNRRFFERTFKAELKTGKSGVVVLMDIDNFKMINDTSGHVFGDKVLVEVSRISEEIIGIEHSVSRFGGDEFIFYMEDIAIPEKIIESFFERFKQPIYIEGNTIEITFSFGISCYPKDSNDYTELIRYADMALYTVKGSGKNNYCYFNQKMEEATILKSDVHKELKKALDNDGFKLVYQPQVDIKTGEISAYEALIRLKSACFFPNEFIPVAEEIGAIIPIGRWVVEEVLRQMDEWRSLGAQIRPVSINYSVVQLQDIGFIDFLMDCLKKYSISASLVELEVTENIFINQYHKAKEFFEAITKIGLKLSIDDFGTGYSSINYLINLPIAKMKLDRTLINQFLNERNTEAIQSLIQFTHNLNLEVVAEGVEFYEQVEQLRLANCDYIQGYYFSKPIEAGAVMENIKQIYKVDKN